MSEATVLTLRPSKGCAQRLCGGVGVVAIEGANVGHRQRRPGTLDQRLQPLTPAERILTRRLELADLPRLEMIGVDEHVVRTADHADRRPW
jgi:hypothetical protein